LQKTSAPHLEKRNKEGPYIGKSPGPGSLPSRSGEIEVILRIYPNNPSSAGFKPRDSSADPGWPNLNHYTIHLGIKKGTSNLIHSLDSGLQHGHRGGKLLDPVGWGHFHPVEKQNWAEFHIRSRSSEERISY
jgi:hypothetical protein